MSEFTAKRKIALIYLIYERYLSVSQYKCYYILRECGSCKKKPFNKKQNKKWIFFYQRERKNGNERDTACTLK